MNKLVIIGNLTRDPETTETQSGKTVCHFTVAVNRRKKSDGTQEADFFRVSTFGTMAENCQKYLAKGRKVGVSGQVSCHAFQGQDGSAKASLEVFAENVEFLTPSGQGSAAQSEPAPQTDPQTGFQAVETDELPF